jgi:agmatine deiminase
MMHRRDVIRTLSALGLGAFTEALGMTGIVRAADTSSARASGFRMPLESAPHERTFMQWPSRASIYGSARALEAVRGKIALIANTIAGFEPVVVLAGPDGMATARRVLDAKIELWPIETEDLWCRDSGPTFVRSAKGDIAVSELNFNGWGNKQGHADDGRIARRVAAKLKLPVFDNGTFGEGGGVEVDGDGTVLAHESCWVNRNRNTQSKAEVERMLLDALGAERMIWAPGVKGADITDYHIDALARYVKPGQVVIQLPRNVDTRDPWSVSAYETYDILKAARDAKGRKLDIVVIHEPDPTKIRSTKADFVSCYPNYYVCNGAVIGAEFGDANADAEAQKILGQLYPGRQIVSLNVDPIGEAGGGIHCATQQQPAAEA